ncbi:MAG: hypothetical protein K2L96_08140 [Muribaculaceae bacterium]|nr:hypothetical protein [Muribaculaceae bacterium]
MKEPFRPSATAYARAESGRVLKYFIPIAAIIFLASLAGALYDVRWLFAGMMFVMVLAPAAFFFLWFGMTGRQDARLRMRPQRWSVGEEKLHIEFFRFEDSEEAAPESSINIQLSDICGFERQGSWWRVHTTRADNAILLAPIEHLDVEIVKILGVAAFRTQDEDDDVTLA